MIVHKILQQTQKSATKPVDTSSSSSAGGGDGNTSTATPVLLACSALSTEHRNLLYSRKLNEDRRGFFDHLRPKSLIKNAVRITLMQTTTVFTHYCSDQLKEDLEREDRIERGEITAEDAEKEDKEWQEREWNLRLDALPHRITIAFLKYQCTVLVMRFYESVAARRVDEVTLDKLTIDTFECAKRTAKEKHGGELARDMMHTCWQANMIGFLADYSVHQVILAFGYYKYVQERRRRLQKHSNLNVGGDEDAIHSGSVALSFLTKSAFLAVSRVFGLAFASVGGGIGSVVMPGWGTLAGTNFGDSIALGLTDDGNLGSPPA